MGRILGIDVGTNSLGLSVRDENISSNPNEQIIYNSVNLFESGVGNGQSGEFSFAAERTKSRSQRKLYKVRRYRKWETIKLLIDEKYCPLTKEDFERWSVYDKSRGLKREYPIDNKEFEQWIRLDFNGDGVPDYSTPYELRYELATKQLDFSLEINRFKLGRAIYHIAQRRGFKSSKGETIRESETKDETETNAENVSVFELKKSELEKAEKVSTYMQEHSLPTVGCALHMLSASGERVRKEYTVIRQQYKEEIEYIFDFQKGLSKDTVFFRRLVSEKKNEGTVFYKRPLQSQKGLVGMCTLEPSKPRCPQSRPEYEDFRAWSFINSIRFGVECRDELPLEWKEAIIKELFIRATDFKFEKIRHWIERKTSQTYSYSSDKKKRTINYKDNTSVNACSVSNCFRQLLGENWKEWTMMPQATHTNSSDRNSFHQVVYKWEDVWHVCFGADDEEPLKLFSEKSRLDYGLLTKLWNTMPIAYANLSLKAINNINHFLKKGLIYSEAALLAKLPDIFKERWSDDVENILLPALEDIITQNEENRRIINVANSLIANYKSQPDEEKQGFRDYSYVLAPDDYLDIVKIASDAYGKKTWESMEKVHQDDIIEKVASLYQHFFNDEQRQFIRPAKLDDDIKNFLADNFDFLDTKKMSKLYHHSQIEYYKPSSPRRIVLDDKVLSMKLLDSPAIASLRNPMALRVLYTLRRKVNELLLEGIIDDDTRVVVEVARELNDANMRWAIKHYQDVHKAENEEFKKSISEFVCSDDDIKKVRLLCEQHDCNASLRVSEKKESKKQMDYERNMNELIKKYRLWIEQGGFCIYTGKPISMSSLLNGSNFEIEHTIPRSLSFDDSLSNQTLCDSEYNRNVKKSNLPSQLNDYERIKQNIAPWIERVEEIRGYIAFWKNKSRKAQTKPQKDNAIRQQHLWRMELDYWQKKVDSFLMSEVKTGFRNNQLVDTSIIAKYTLNYLKSVFGRVDVQKGQTTASFRKILGIQDDDTLKVRDNNSHHAIDAMVLTFVPTAVHRDELLQLFYQRLEAKEQGHDYSQLDVQIAALLKRCGLKADFSSIIERIKKTVLSVYEKRNQSLTPSRRRKRIRGKIVPLRDEQGNILFEKDAEGNYRRDIYGHLIPQAKQWQKGDSIRGSLHDKTYYGAITQYGDDSIKFVIRRDLTYKSGNAGEFKDWKELEAAIVNKELVRMMQSQFPPETSFKDACEQGIYMLDKQGNKINQIRHVRCYASTSNPVKVRKQTFASRKEYKNFYYARNGENIAYALYEAGKKRAFRCISLFEAARISNFEGIHNVLSVFPDTIDEKNTSFRKVFALMPGCMVILKSEEERLTELTQEEISNRLYKVRRIYNPGDGRLQLQHHLEARDDKALQEAYPKEKYGKTGVNGFSEVDFNKPKPRLLLSLGKQNFWVENQDFVVKNGTVRSIND